MADTRSQNQLMDRLLKLLHDSEKKKELKDDEVETELRWILKNLQSNYRQLNGKTVISLLKILGNCNYGYKNLKGQIGKDTKQIPEDIWKSLLEVIIDSLDKIDKSQLLTIFSKFNEMNVWQNADEHFKKFSKDFLKLIDLYFREFNVAQTGRTLFNLGYQWDDLTPNIKNTILDEMEYLKPKELIDLLWVCAALGMPSEELSKKFKVSIAENVNSLIAQQVKNIQDHPEIELTGKSEWSDATTMLRQIQQVRLYFDLPIDKIHGELLDNQLDACIDIEKKLFEKTYRTFQDSVISYLKKIAAEYGFKIEVEASPLHMKPVDIFIPEKMQIIELNGPHHYNLHGDIRPKDTLNKNIFEKNGYQVNYIKQSVWNDQPDKFEFLLNGLLALRIIDAAKVTTKTEINTEEKKQEVKRKEQSLSSSGLGLHGKKQSENKKPENLFYKIEMKKR